MHTRVVPLPCCIVAWTVPPRKWCSLKSVTSKTPNLKLHQITLNWHLANQSCSLATARQQTFKSLLHDPIQVEPSSDCTCYEAPICSDEIRKTCPSNLLQTAVVIVWYAKCLEVCRYMSSSARTFGADLFPILSTGPDAHRRMCCADRFTLNIYQTPRPDDLNSARSTRLPCELSREYALLSVLWQTSRRIPKADCSSFLYIHITRCFSWQCCKITMETFPLFICLICVKKILIYTSAVNILRWEEYSVGCRHFR